MVNQNILIGLTIFSQIFLIANADSDAILVTIDQGTLRGRTKIDYWGNPYFSFEGIPFAEPPIGELRFKAPRPPKPWTGILDATRPGSPCMQEFLGFAEPIIQNVSIGGSEDCLTLQVYTHMDDEPKPVMVWIHAGRHWLCGAASDGVYGEQFLMSEDIVLVKIQFRLDVLGFLSLPDPELGIPGNAGLKDQVMALKWVKQNIKNFGGDPNRITIFGFSAGGISTHLLYLSPMAKGLFSSVIAQSGSAVEPWVVMEQPTTQFAELLKCPVTDNKQMFDCLRTKEAIDLIEASATLRTNVKLADTRGFSVVIENSLDEETFLPSTVEKIIQSGSFNDVPFLTGYLPHDGISVYLLEGGDPTITDNTVLIPMDIKMDRHSKEAQEFGDKIKNLYYGSETPSQENVDKLSEYYTDIMYLRKMYQNVKNQAKVAKAPQYFYRLMYDTEELSPNLIKFPKPLYQHIDDIRYLFTYSRTPKQLDSKSVAYQGVKRMLKLWTTFAKTGNPNPDNQDEFSLGVEWKPVSPEHFYYINIAPEPSLGEDPEKERMEFWEDVYKKYENYVISL